MTRVLIEGITKTWADGTRAVVDLDLEVGSGELMVLVGPSGCGKSTVLRMLAGLTEPSRGRIFFDGVCVNGFEPRSRDVAMVFQNYALYPHMTVEGNLMFPLRLRGVRRREARSEARRTAEQLGLLGLLERKPKALSGGQQQRVALGRAMIREPRLFLLDEPLSNLDAHTREAMRSEIRSLHERLGTTMVYVTHDQSEAMALGDRIAVLREGRLEQCAPPLELYQDPGNRFVGSFIGSPPMSFHPVSPTEGGRIDGVRIEGLAAPDRPALLGLRPHDLEVLPRGAGGPLSFEGRVESAEAHGHETHVRVRAGRGSFLGIAKGGFLPGKGACVSLELRGEAIRWFDPGTGARLRGDC